MKLTYLGTACMTLEMAGVRLLTDPALDPRGTRYDFGPAYTPRDWFASEKTYETPLPEGGLGRFDAALLSHDHHADNLDYAGRRLLASAAVERVLTTTAGARRLAAPSRGKRGALPEGDSAPGDGLGLGSRVQGLAWGATTQLGALKITATPACHGPLGTPRIHEVAGFLLEAPGEPTVWISGDTVPHPRLSSYLTALRASGKRVDVAVVHCGGVRFPKLPVLGNRLFTFDSASALAACAQLDPGLVVPVHREGWTHFRQPESELRAAVAGANYDARTRFLELGGALEV